MNKVTLKQRVLDTIEKENRDFTYTEIHNMLFEFSYPGKTPTREDRGKYVSYMVDPDNVNPYTGKVSFTLRRQCGNDPRYLKKLSNGKYRLMYATK